jgi:hypothetical protein
MTRTQDAVPQDLGRLLVVGIRHDHKEHPHPCARSTGGVRLTRPSNLEEQQSIDDRREPNT